MRNILIITGCMAAVASFAVGCSDNDDPGSVYMPDMAYSRAYETYAGYDTSVFTTDANAWGRADQSKIFYNQQPVAGTIARGDLAPYPFKNDSSGYLQSASIKNPLDTASIDMKEAERLYLINCGICHGAKLDGNGPLWKDGQGPYPAAPKNLQGADMKALSEGTMYHVATFGKGQMGSYASQMTSQQRWMVVAYIKKAQAGGGKMTTDSTTAKAGVDSTAKTK